MGPFDNFGAVYGASSGFLWVIARRERGVFLDANSDQASRETSDPVRHAKSNPQHSPLEMRPFGRVLA